jgi:hypothetical protein
MSIYLPQVINGTVATAGTRVKLSSASAPFRLAIITALAGNTGVLYIGGETVSSSVYGIALTKGTSISITSSGNDPTFDLSNFYADVGTNSDGFSILYF